MTLFVALAVALPLTLPPQESLALQPVPLASPSSAAATSVTKTVSPAPSLSEAQSEASSRPEKILSGSKSQVDVTNQADGYVKVRYKDKTAKLLKVKVSKLKADGTEEFYYYYDLNNQANWETYSFQMGDGKYVVKVLENTTGNKYATMQTETLTIKLDDPYKPFLIPIQFVNYTSTSKAVLKAAELAKGKKTDLEKVDAIYAYVVNNIVYDTPKAQQVIDGKLDGYVPQIDVILDGKKGICFDYASLLASMLRSQGIPTKLIFGYVAPNNVYHAWNEIYIKGVGWIKVNSSVYFDGKNWSRMDSTFAAANKNGTKTDFIGNAKNYSKKYQF